MSSSRKLTKKQCKELGREIGDYLTGRTEMNEIHFFGLIVLASQLKDDYECLSMVINSTGCQGLSSLLEQRYPDNIFVVILVEVIKEYEKQN